MGVDGREGQEATSTGVQELINGRQPHSLPTAAKAGAGFAQWLGPTPRT